ncbi:MAG: hypothetical protein P8N23_05150 [Methylophilaceae bacterium]|nr:hypothetical protein [Methylophilaceae bacterium]
MALKNSKRSGGPKTAEGKLSAARNSLKFGAYSMQVVIPGESEEEFQHLADQFTISFRPADIAEAAMVLELASLTWKKLRLERLEQAEFVRVLEALIPLYEVSRHFKIDDELEWLIRDLSVLDPQFIQSSRDQLSYIKTFPSAEISHEEFLKLPETLPDLYNSIVVYAKEKFDFGVDDVAPSEILKLQVTTDRHGKEPLLKFILRKHIKRINGILWADQHLEQIQVAIQKVKQKHLLSNMQRQGVMRAYDDLSRAYYRTLSELRKQQQWRQKMGVVDIEDVEDDE